MSEEQQEPKSGAEKGETPPENADSSGGVPSNDQPSSGKSSGDAKTAKKVARKPRTGIRAYVPPSEDAEAEMRSLVELAGLGDEFDQLAGATGKPSVKSKKKGGTTASQKEIDQAVTYLRDKQAEASGDDWIYEDATYFEYIDEDAYYFGDREKPIINIGTSAKKGYRAIICGVALAGVVFVLIPLTQYMAASPKGAQETAPQTFVIPPPTPPPPEKPPPPPPPPKEKLEEEKPPPPKLSLADIELSLNVGAGSDIGGDFGMPGLDLSAESLGSVDIFEIAELDSPPRVLVQTPPQYPANMRNQKIEGRVFVMFIVDQTGRVTQPRATQSPHPDLSRAAVEAVSKWKFEPPLKDGRRVRARMGIAIPFKL